MDPQRIFPYGKTHHVNSLLVQVNRPEAGPGSAGILSLSEIGLIFIFFLTIILFITIYLSRGPRYYVLA